MKDKKTVADIIRKATDDELAEFLAHLSTNFAVRLCERLGLQTEEIAACYEQTKKEFLEFLKKPAEE